jgi:hypothetical protein
MREHHTTEEERTSHNRGRGDITQQGKREHNTREGRKNTTGEERT